MSLRVAYIPNSEMAALPLIEAVRGLPEAKCGAIEVMARCAAELQDPDTLEAFLAFASRVHIVIVHLMGGTESIPGYARLRSLVEGSRVHFHLVGTAEALSAEVQPVSTLPEKEGQRLSAYVRQGGVANLRNLLLWLATLLDGAPDVAEPPRELPWEGIYHPDEEGIPDPETYHYKRLLPGRPTIGVLFFRSYWAAGNLAHVDALIRGLEQAGANVLPVFTNGVPDVDLGARGAAAAIERYFLRDGQPQVDAVVSLLMLFSIGWGSQGPATGDGAPNVLKRLGVPLIQAIANSQTEEEWRTGLQGLSPMDVSFSVAIPEFDGALITVPVACRMRRDIDPVTGARIVRYQPVPERIAKLARLALNWARLRFLPNADKRVAVILHNYPPRDDTIGTAFGLDAPASVVNILRILAAEGYQTGDIPASGDALIAEIMERVTNDRRLLSAERARLAVDSVTPATYADWFETFDESIRTRMVDDWGAPPGDVFNYEGRLLIPGVLRGNVFIGLQPPRGFGEDASKIYHSPDATPTHHYLAYYRWLRDVFGAHVVLHIGKHGSLEWLPGKAVGLSAECFPDLAIAELPNIYPYIINNPSEGTQAKRRSYACIVDHLVPAMMRADSYGDLARIENLLQDYYHSRQLDPQKQPVLRNLIWEAVEEAHLQAELQVDARPPEEDWDAFLQRLHGYLSELASAQVKDGLHILGEPPPGERLVNMLFALTQLDNGDIPSLLRSVAEARGYDYDDLLANRGQLVPELLKTKGMILAEMEDVARSLIRALAEHDFSPAAVPEICHSAFYPDAACAPAADLNGIATTLDYLCKEVVPRIAATTGELCAVRDACAGRYVPSGPSGAPTRGMADILPTGRNFYSVDPLTIPSPAAWREGMALANTLLARYRLDTGDYPRNVGIVIWGGGVMRTKGDDIAEVLYLLGVRPVWDGRSGRVKGLAVIPGDELGRPRIDVTVRISGLLRDAFPTVVTLIDRGVQLVADLEEPGQANYVRENVLADVAQKIAAGLDAAEARREAGYRVFGCKPGSYGAGVSHAIEAGNWQTVQDFGAIYLVWGGYAYGTRDYGRAALEPFRQQLARLDLTVKNEDNREHDILDSDDFYSYHGGLIAAVKAFKGEAPRAYVGDSADPERLQVRSLAEETKRIFRTRVLNPKWIASMQRHGYKGAGDLAKLVDHAFGWDATAEVVDDWMYDRLAKTYALDPELRQWLERVNPWALQSIAQRLLEAAQRGMWAASEEMLEKLQQVYLGVDALLEGRDENRSPA